MHSRDIEKQVLFGLNFDQKIIRFLSQLLIKIQEKSRKSRLEIEVQKKTRKKVKKSRKMTPKSEENEVKSPSKSSLEKS